jgi:multimeric flavodoxin WrbA
MRLLCISASNIEPFRQQSASTRACRLVGEIACERAAAEVDILPLIDYELTPCRMCGSCVSTGRCCRDEAFNQVYARMQAADAVFLVVPHYAPFPSKVMMLCEKLQEMSFLSYCQDPSCSTPLKDKPLGVIGHGGQTEEALPYYRSALVKPIASALAGIGMQVIGAGEDCPDGVAFGILSITMPEGEIFCKIEHDWETIRRRLIPLVENVLSAV